MLQIQVGLCVRQYDVTLLAMARMNAKILPESVDYHLEACCVGHQTLKGHWTTRSSHAMEMQQKDHSSGIDKIGSYAVFAARIAWSPPYVVLLIASRAADQLLGLPSVVSLCMSFLCYLH